MRFDFALSFAGPSRSVARDLAGRLRAFGFRVFFDEDYQHELLGVDGSAYLRNIYSFESRFCVVLITEEYDRRTWTQLERESIQGRELRGEAGILLPVLIDGHKPFWLPETRIYFDLSKRSVAELASLLYRKAAPPGQVFVPFGELVVEGRKLLARSVPKSNAFLLAGARVADPPCPARMLRILGTELSMTEIPIASRATDFVCCGEDAVAIYIDPGGPPREVKFVSLRTGEMLGHSSGLPGFDETDLWHIASHDTKPLAALCSGYGRIVLAECHPFRQLAAFTVATKSYNPHACFLGNEQICILVDRQAVTYTISGDRIKSIDLGEECLSAVKGPIHDSLIVGLVNNIVCLDLNSGDIIWKHDAPASGVFDLVRESSSSAVAAIAGFPFGSNRLLVLNGFDGKEIVCPLPQPAIFQGCAFSGAGELLVSVESGTTSSTLYAYRMIKPAECISCIVKIAE